MARKLASILCNITISAQRLLEDMESEGYRTANMEELSCRLADLKQFLDEQK